MGRCALNAYKLSIKEIRARRKLLLQAYEMGLNNANKWHFERFLEKEPKK
jgi:hypothetical protein